MIISGVALNRRVYAPRSRRHVPSKHHSWRLQTRSSRSKRWQGEWAAASDADVKSRSHSISSSLGCPDGVCLSRVGGGAVRSPLYRVGGRVTRHPLALCACLPTFATCIPKIGDDPSPGRPLERLACNRAMPNARPRSRDVLTTWSRGR